MNVDPLVLVAWVDRATGQVTGRASGAGLTVIPDWALPELPSWM